MSLIWALLSIVDFLDWFSLGKGRELFKAYLVIISKNSSGKYVFRTVFENYS